MQTATTSDERLVRALALVLLTYFIDLFAPCWPVLHGSLSCSLLVCAYCSDEEEAVPELAIALLFCCGTGRFSQCVYKREYYQSGGLCTCPIGESASLFAQSLLLVYPNAACLPHYE